LIAFVREKSVLLDCTCVLAALCKEVGFLAEWLRRLPAGDSTGAALSQLAGWSLFKE